jgi:macrolide transport system ATP-binding/permease protein
LDLLDGFHAEGRTIILVTHDMAVARHAERVVEMVDGQIHHDHFSKGRR